MTTIDVPVVHPPDTSIPAPARRRRRWLWLPIGAIVAGLALLTASVVWSTVAVPALVRFPTSVDLHPQYQGTFTTFVDQSTYAPLATPSTAPLAVDRAIQGVPAQSTNDRVLVRETIGYDIQGLPAAQQIHQYVMDRRTNANLADPAAWAFQPTNVLDRSAAYWVGFPRGSNGTDPVTMYKDEIGGTFVVSGAGVTEQAGGLHLVAYDASEAARPLTNAYLSALDSVVKLPRSLTFDQLKPSLIAAGVPVDATLAALAKVATPADLQALVALTAKPIPLQYIDTFSGRTFVEPDTGAIVDAQNIVERVSARPSSDAVTPLLTILQRYQSQPAVASAIAGLSSLSTKPLPIFEYRYSQTPASVATIAKWVSDQRGQLHLVEDTVPMALAIGGGLLVVLGLGGLGFWAWKRTR